MKRAMPCDKLKEVGVHGVRSERSGGVDLGSRGWQERGYGLTATGRFKARCQVIQDIVALLSAGRNDSQHPLHEPAPVHAVSPAADSTPDHCLPQHPFRRVIRRVDTL